MIGALVVSSGGEVVVLLSGSWSTTIRDMVFDFLGWCEIRDIIKAMLSIDNSRFVRDDYRCMASKSILLLRTK